MRAFNLLPGAEGENYRRVFFISSGHVYASICAVESAGKYGFMSQGFPWRRSAATPPKLMFRLVKPNFMLNPSKAVGLERQTLEIMLDHFRSSQNVLNFPKHKSEGPSNKSELKKPGGH